MKQPLVSVVIPNWNGKKWLQMCLPSLSKARYPNMEIIVVNNGSVDDSHIYIKKYFPKIKIVTIKHNVGYAKACNIGVKHAGGKYLLMMNNDTTVEPDFLIPLVNDLEKDKTVGIVQPQIRSMAHRKLLDSVGTYLTFTGFLYYYGLMKPHSLILYQKPVYCYSIKGACFLMSKKDFMDLNGYDEDFFAYIEETDLCHRMWLYGKKVLYDPKSIMYHWGGGDTLPATKSEDSYYRAFRNRFYSYVKNLGFGHLVKILPIHMVGCWILSGYFLVKKQFTMAYAIFSGSIFWVFDLPALLKKRKHIQTSVRKVRDADIDPYIYRSPRLSYYLLSFRDIRKYKDEQ